MEFKNGLMDHDMKDSGAMIRQMVKENLFMQMETFMKENGLMIRHMVKGLILTLMELIITEIG